MAGNEVPAHLPDDSEKSGTLGTDLSDAAVFTANKPAASAVTRSRPREMPAQPGTGAAIFSTDGGHLPRRSVPIPPPPVIVRSVQVQGVVDSANYWRNKFPDFYHCLFPDHGWTISDLWDECDIHLESPRYLEEVLRFILEDNHQSALNFAREWCHRQQFSGKIEKLAGGFKLVEDSVDRYSFVDEFFGEDELEVCPRPFLVHTLWGLKQAMHDYMAERHPISTTTGSIEVQVSSVASTNRATSSTVKQQTAMTMLPHPTIFKHTIASHSFGGQFVPPLNPFPPPPRPKRHYGPVPGLQIPAAIPAYFGDKVRNATKSKRSGSTPFIHPMHMHAFSENVRLPSSGHVTHLPGPLRDPHQLVSNIPVGPNIFASVQNGLDHLPNATMTPSTVHLGQNVYPPMLAPASIPSAAPLLDRFEDPTFQQVGPFSDMANIQYPPIRAFNARPYPHQGSQGLKSSTLYNPYDATRPDKADFATMGNRKSIHGNFANNSGRGRNYSMGAFERAGNRTNEWDNSESIKKSNGGSIGKAAPTRDTKSNYESDPNITKDKEFGCDHDFIGAKNTTVRQLFVRNLPEGTTSHEIRNFFGDHAATTPTMVEIKPSGDRKDVCNAFVYFKTTEDTRIALRASFPLFKGREVPVSVAKRNFQIGYHHRTTKQDPQGSTAGTSTSARSNPYSPQDARSDLHRISEQHHRSNAPNSRGSPEGTKRKNVPVKSTVDHKDRGVDVFGQGDSIQNVATLKEIVSTQTDDEALNSASTQRPNQLLDTKTIGEEDSIVLPTADRLAADETGATSPGTFTESIPVDAHAALLVSPTKVALPPRSKGLQGIVQDNIETAITLKDARVVHATVTTPVQEDVTSEDDQKNDLSFHSAQESQPSVKEEEALQEPVDLQCENAVDDDTKSPKHMQLKEQQLNSADSHNDQTTTCNESIVAESCEGGEIAAGVTFQVEVSKKQGAKRTESLNPYSKASKAQLKKIKDKEKKQKKVKESEKKKDKEEMADKGADENEIKLSNSKRDQDEIESGFITPAESHATGNREGSAHGKVLRTVDDLNHTKNLRAHEPAAIQDGERGISARRRSPVFPASSPDESAGTEIPAAQNGGALSASLPKDQGGRSEAKNKTKAVPPAIAIPSLELLKKKSPPMSSTAQPHTAYFTADSVSPFPDERECVDTVGNTSKAFQDREGMADAPLQRYAIGLMPTVVSARLDTMSVGSSSTIRGNSPVANEFHTPSQTPGVAEKQPSEEVRAKKKKKGKKKSKNTEGMSGEQSQEAFHEQLSQVTDTQSGYYALRGSDAPPQEALRRGDDKEPKSIIRQVQAYMKEKASAYSRAPEMTWSRNNRKCVEKMTTAESDQIVSGSRLAATPGLARYVEDAALPPGSEGKAKKAGKVAMFGD